MNESRRRPASSSDTSPAGYPTIDVGGVAFHDLSSSDAVGVIIARARARLGGIVYTPNADYVVQARRNAIFRRHLSTATLCLPDGMGVVYASRIAGRPLRGTVTGRLLLPAIAKAAAIEQIPIGLYGSGPGVAGAAASRLQGIYPGLQVTAATPPTPLVVGSTEDEAAVGRVLAHQPRIMIVGLSGLVGSAWMQEHASRNPDTLFVNLGAAMDITAGRFRTAPGWMTRWGLEWAFRLAQEPRRLARRYLIDDPWVYGWALRTRFRRD